MNVFDVGRRSPSRRSCRCSRRRSGCSCAGSGTELFDVDGNRYLDFLSGIAVTSLGHANPAVAAAISAQAGELLHVSNFFANPQATAAAVAVDELLARSHRAPRAGVLHQQRRRGDRVRDQARPQARRPRPPHRRQRLRQLPRPHARRPGGDRAAEPSTSRSSRCPRASATSPGATSTRSRRRSTARSPPCSSSRSWARAACTRRRPATWRRSAASATRPGR